MTDGFGVSATQLFTCEIFAEGSAEYMVGGFYDEYIRDFRKSPGVSVERHLEGVEERDRDQGDCADQHPDGMQLAEHDDVEGDCKGIGLLRKARRGPGCDQSANLRTDENSAKPASVASI